MRAGFDGSLAICTGSSNELLRNLRIVLGALRESARAEACATMSTAAI